MKTKLMPNISLLRILQLGPEIQIQSNVKVVKSENENSGNTTKPGLENPFCFQQPVKKIKPEDHSSENETHWDYQEFERREQWAQKWGFSVHWYQRRIPKSPKRLQWFGGQSPTKKSSNKLRMKALVGWNIFYHHSKLINYHSFLNKDKDWYE